MDVGYDSMFLHWQNPLDSLSAMDIIPKEDSVESFLDDYLEIEEDFLNIFSKPVNVVPHSPSSTPDVLFQPCANAKSMSNPTWPSDFRIVAALATAHTTSSSLLTSTDLNETQRRLVSDAALLQTDTSVKCTSSGALKLVPSFDVIIPTSPSSLGSVTTCLSDSELLGERGIHSVTEECSPLPAKRKIQIAPKVSRKKLKSLDLRQPLRQKLKASRPPTLEQHILRERKRRDDMAAKFVLLERILPPMAKRDKVVIVEDATKMVKTLRIRKEELLKRRSQLKQRSLIRNKPEFASPHPSSKISKKYQTYQKVGDLQFAASPKQSMQATPASILDRRKPIDPNTTLMRHSASYPIAAATVEVTAALKTERSSCRELLQVHAQVSEEEILVDMLFRQYPPNLLTRVVKTVESMKLDVVRCCLQRVPCGFVECTITAKLQVECQPTCHNTQSSAKLLVGALQAAFGHVSVCNASVGSYAQLYNS